MKKPIQPKWFAALLLLVASAGGYQYYRLDHAAAGPLILYGDVDIREIDLAFRQSGRLATVQVDEGAHVHAGQLLATLDDVPFREALAAAQANVQAAQARLDLLLHGNRPQQIAEAREAVHQAEAVAANASADLVRQQSLLPGGTASQRTVDAARAASDAARASLAAARQQLDLMLAGSRNEDIAAARAQLAAARANREAAQTALNDTRLEAPADAIVFSRIREAGSMVSPTAPVYILSQTQPVFVRAYVSESDLGQVAPGTVVKVSSDSSPTQYGGTIGFVSPRAEFTPKTVETTDLRTDLVYRIRITINHPDQALRQGMPVTIRVMGHGRNPT